MSNKNKSRTDDRIPTTRADVRLDLDEADAVYDLLNGAEYKTLLWEARKKIGVAVDRAKSGIGGAVRMHPMALLVNMQKKK